MKKLISFFIPKDSRLTSALRKLYYHWLPDVEENLLTILEEKVKIIDHDKFYFVQVGAHDGNYDDPIVRIRNGHHHWRGILIEPQPDVFRKLKENLPSSSRLRLMNCAVSDHDGVQTLYKISFSESEWATGLSSFKKESIVRSIENGYIDRMAKENHEVVPSKASDYISEVSVNTISFPNLVAQFESATDMILVDTEGYDFVVVNKLLDLGVKPSIWWFEF
ncbi:MAG: FkbM family methyltransferase [Chryseolinea sp.]